MKKFFFALAILFSVVASSQSIESVNVSSSVSLSYPRLITSFKLSTYAYAIIISIDDEWGFQKQNGNAYAGTVFGGVPSGSKVFDVSGLSVGQHKVFVDVYTNPRTIVDRRIVFFEVTN